MALIAVAVLLASAVFLVLPGSGAQVLPRRPSSGSMKSAQTRTGRTPGAWGGRLCWPRSASRDRPVPVELLVTDVASMLRAGAAPGEAWWVGAGVRVDGVGRPLPEALAQRLSGSVGGGRIEAAGIVAGCRVAHDVGAPLAPVLESVARSVVQASDARTEREAALAGPRATGRLLMWLPVAGLVFGSSLGADSFGFLFGGPLGFAVALTGLGLMFAGVRWTRGLIRSAAQEGELD